MSHQRSKETVPTAPGYTFEIYMSDGRIWRREGSFEKLMKEAADYWKDEGKDIQ